MLKDNSLWLMIEWNHGMTWTRAEVPPGIGTTRELVSYLQRGGRVRSNWLEIPTSARFTPRVVGMTVLARLFE